MSINFYSHTVFKISLVSFTDFPLIIIISFLSSDQGLGPDHPDAHVLVPLLLGSSDLGLDLVPDLPGDVTLALEVGPCLRREEGKARSIIFSEGGVEQFPEKKFLLCKTERKKKSRKGSHGVGLYYPGLMFEFKKSYCTSHCPPKQLCTTEMRGTNFMPRKIPNPNLLAAPPMM